MRAIVGLQRIGCAWLNHDEENENGCGKGEDRRGITLKHEPPFPEPKFRHGEKNG
jgi:hypothetical protein